MSGSLAPRTLHGRRWGSVGGAIITLPVALLLIAFAIFHLLPSGRSGAAATAAAAGGIVLFYGTDFIVRAIRPNRLVLTESGLELVTAYGARSWAWSQLVGIHGWWHLIILIKDQSGRTRWIPIGHWDDDFGRTMGAFAERGGVEVPGLVQAENRLSPAPLFMISGALLVSMIVFVLNS